MNLHWTAIRSLNGSQAAGFEELCAQLARAEIPAGAKFERKGAPDAGVECFSVLSDGSEWGWQAKYFTALGDSQFKQLGDSVRTALSKHPSLTRYFVCVPLDRPDARIAGKKSAMERWTEHVSKWEGWARESDRIVDFVWWGSSELLERLARAEHIGRVFFWFGEPGFDESWFNARLNEALHSAGPRYTPPVHVDLPVAKDLELFGRTALSIEAVKAQAVPIRKALHMLDAPVPGRDDPSRNVPAGDLLRAVNTVLQGFSELSPDPVGELPLRTISERIREAESTASTYHETLSQHVQEYDAQQPDDGGNSRRDPQNPFNERIHRIYRLQNALRAAGAATNHAAEFANTRLLVLTGEAGTGKTHLLCDSAQRRVGTGAPTVLLMGQRFLSAEEPWTQALQQLDLRGITAEQFVGALEAAAQAANCRALLIIDALNEGQGRAVWPPHLAAFLAPLEASPWIGALLSVRSTYADVVVPEEIHRKAAAAVHQGFADHEYDATRRFFSHYGLELPSTPILQPEFRNPLFLKTICQGLRDDGHRRLPRGFRGISAAFDLYLHTKNRRLATDLGYNPQDPIVRRALRSLAQLLLKNGRSWLTRAVAEATVDEFLPGREYERSLYRGLVSEGVLVEEVFRPSENEHTEIVFISYERYADHVIADLLLTTHLDTESPGSAFAEGAGLAFLWDERTYTPCGLLEALCIQVPERTGMELAELAPSLADRAGFVDSFRQSLVWRRLDAFSEATLDVLNRLLASRHDHDDTLETLLTVASLADHPYNAEFLDRQLRRRSMPDRDAWWSTYLHRAWGTNGAVDRIVHWASDVTPGTELGDRADELCSIVMAWMLTTSNRFLRDRATKALVSLLTGRLVTVRILLDRFADVDDPYVAERIYAAVYGVVMHSCDRRGVGPIASTVYELVFADGAPPAHVLLRDYARGIIERALYLGADIDIDPGLIRPPYTSMWPEIPNDTEIEPYLTDRSDGAYYISHSVMDDDFARYVIGTNFSSTNWLSLRLDEPPWCSSEARMEKILPTLSETSLEAWKRCRDAEAVLSQRQLLQRLVRVTVRNGAAPQDAVGDSDQVQPSPGDLPPVSRAKATLLEALEDFRNGLTTDQKREVDSILTQRRAGDREYPPRFDLKLIQRHVLKRVFDLGWTTERFGDFDSFDVGSTFREAAKPERIGKKYQWIAYHEILAHIADHYQYREQHREDVGDRAYEGPWQEFLRDIDPSITFSSKPGGTGWGGHEPSWWAQERYTAWADGSSARDWMVREDDIPDVAGLLAGRDSCTGIGWLNLHGYFNWRQSHPADVESSDVDRRDLWLLLTGYFVHMADAEAFMTWAEGVDFMGRWMPDPPEIHGMFFGEYAWAPAFRYFSSHPDYDLNGWVQPDHSCPVTVRPATLECSCKPSDFDCSLEADYGLQVSHWDLLERLKLRWTGRGADFVDRESNLAVFDPTAHEDGPTALLARDDLVRRYLNESDMALCWTVLGEKRIIGREASRNYQGALHISGAYTLGEDGPDGFLKFRRDRLDQEDQTGTPHASGSASTSREAGSSPESPDSPAREATARGSAGAEGTES